MTLCRVAAGRCLLDMDVRTRTLPAGCGAPEAFDPAAARYIELCEAGRSALPLRTGETGFLTGGELAVDRGHLVHGDGAAYFPHAAYTGLRLYLLPGPELDAALSLRGQPGCVSSALLERYGPMDRLLAGGADAQVWQCCRAIREDLRAGQPREMVAMDVCRLLYLLQARLGSGEQRRVFYPAAQVDIARRTMELLTGDLSRRHAAAELAAGFGISESSLKNYFRGVFGRGYGECLNELRMQKAAELLRSRDMRVAAVADAVGYATRSRFARAFRAYYGDAPMEYARKKRLEEMRASSA